MSLFRQAIAEGNLDSVKEIIHNDRSCLEVCEKDQLPALHYACILGKLHIIKYLVQEGCDLRYPATDAFMFPIHCAILCETDDRMAVLRYLIEDVGISPHDGNQVGSTPILLAQSLKRLDVIEYLTKNHGCIMNMALFEVLKDKGQLSEDLVNACMDVEFEYVTPKSVKSKESYSFINSASMIHKAAMYGNLDELEQLIAKKGQDPCKFAEHGYQPIHAAASAGQLGIIQTLIGRYNVDPKARTAAGEFQPIHAAAINGHCHVVNFLVRECGVSTEETSQFGDKPIHFACSAGNVQMLHLLIELGSSPNVELVDSGKMLPIHIACVQGKAEIVTELIEKYGVDKSVVDEEGFAPIHYAARGDKREVVEMLIEKYNVPADFQSQSKDGYTALHFCAQNGLVDLFIWLCDKYRLDPRICTYNGYEPIHIAAQHGQLEIIERLISKYRIDPNCRAALNSGQPIHCAAFNGHKKVIEALIETHGVDPASQSKNGLTALHDAAQQGFPEIVEMLVNKYGVDSSSKSISDWFQPIHTACHSGHINVLETLIVQCKVKPQEEMKNKAQCIHLASKTEVVDYLVEVHGVDLLAQDEDGQTLLHYAAAYGWNHIIEHLVVKYKTDLRAKSKDGKQPVHFAAGFGRINTLLMLMSQYNIDPRDESNLHMQSIHWCAFSGKLTILETLIGKYGIDPKQTAEHGLQPIHFAAFRGSEAVVERLIETYNVPPNQLADHGISPLCLAKIAGHDDVVEMLINEFDQDPPSDEEIELVKKCTTIKDLKELKLES